jgi:hypothetical protein
VLKAQTGQLSAAIAVFTLPQQRCITGRSRDDEVAPEDIHHAPYWSTAVAVKTGFLERADRVERPDIAHRQQQDVGVGAFFTPRLHNVEIARLAGRNGAGVCPFITQSPFPRG